MRAEDEPLRSQKIELDPAHLPLTKHRLLHHPARVAWNSADERDLEVLLSGWAGRFHRLPSGHTQCIALLVPGDVLTYPPGVSAAPSSNAVALTPVRTAVFSKGEAESVSADLVRYAEAAAERERDWLCLHAVRLARMSTYGRAAHLLLELHQRLRRTGLGRTTSFELPVGQDLLAELVGVSVTHFNRTLQQLRRDGLISLDAGEVRLLRSRRLRLAADFAPPSGEGEIRSTADAE